MKKLFISLLMAIGLCGLAMAQTTITVSDAGFTSAKATVTFSDADKATVVAADTLLAIANQYNTGSISFQNKPYGVGEILWSGNLQRPVVYANKPTFTEGSSQLELSLTTPEGLDHYLWLYTGKKDGTGKWTYTKLAISSAKFQTKKPEIAISEVSNVSMKATVTLNETLKTQMEANTSVVILKCQSQGDITHSNNGTEYQVGNKTTGYYPATVVYTAAKPTLVNDAFSAKLNNLFDYGETGYLILCFGKNENNKWTYTQGVLNSSAYLTEPLEVTFSEAEYVTCKVSVTLDETMKTAYNNGASVVAFTSETANPAVRHDNAGARYRVGEKVADQFPVVFEGKPTLTTDSKLEFTCTNLEPGSSFFLFLCLGTGTDGAVTYATNTFAKSTSTIQMKSITAPTGLTAGAIKDGKLPLTIEADDQFATMIIKSASAKSIAPKGNLKEGDTYENREVFWDGSEWVTTGTVVAFLAPGVKTYDLPLEAGEACYVHAYAVVEPKTDAAAYAADMVMAPVYRMAEKLPLSYTFSANDYIYDDEAYYWLETMPLLPPGLSTTTAAEPETEELYAYIASAFHVVMQSGEEEDSYLLFSQYPAADEGGIGGGPLAAAEGEEAGGEETPELRWIDWVTPEFTGVALVQARFQTTLLSQGWVMGQYNARKVAEGDEVRIEYSLNGGAWQPVQTFAAADFPVQEGAFYNLTVDFKCAATDTVRIRYSYRSSVAGTMLAVAGYEIVEGRSCATPAELRLVADNTTDRQIQLKWDDNNVTPAGQYLVSYRKYVEPVMDEDGGIAVMAAEEGTPEEGGAEEEADVWETLSVNTAEAVLRNLEGHTAYDIKVQAVCGEGDSSFVSNAVRLSTLLSLPYAESMASSDLDYMSYTFAQTPAGISVANGLPGQTLKAADMQDVMSLMGDNILPSSWSILLSPGFLDVMESNSIAVANTADQAWLTLPAVYVRKTGDFYPKTLTFRVNTYDYAAMGGGLENGNAGIDMIDPELRLYVMVSTNGQFTWNDTVASFDHKALMAEPAEEATPAAETEATEPARGKELSVKLDRYEGMVQIAFYFHNPNKFEMPEQDGPGGFSLLAAEDEAAATVEEPLFLELFDVNFDYNETPCFAVENLKAEAELAEATLTWVGEGAEYGISYGPASAEGYDTTIYRMATETEVQTLKLTGLTSNTEYKVAVVSYCTAGDREHGSIARTTTFTTLRQMYTVTVNITPEGAGTVTGANSYLEGANATLTATANAGYRFVAWMDSEKELSTETSYRFQVTANVTYTAKFEELPTYTLTLTALPAEGGQVEGADKYHEGDTVTVKATANADYKFVAWINGTDTLSTQASYTFQMPAQDVTYTAVFAKGTANEALLQASFAVGTQNGQLYVRNLNGIAVKDINVYGLTGNLINRFAPNSREDLMLPIDAQRAILFVRLNTEKGVAVYKVYLQ